MILLKSLYTVFLNSQFHQIKIGNYNRFFPWFIPFLLLFVWYNAAGQSTKWQSSPFEYKVFIENKGQFDGKDKLENSIIKYGVDNMGFQIYFTPAGLTYRMDEWGLTRKNKRKLAELENEERRHNGKETEKKEDEEIALQKLELLKTTLVHLNWIGANPNVQLIAEDKNEEYFNYNFNDRPSINYVNSFQKLTYKNLYPGIDLVYTFPENKEGIKYAFVVHPGGDISSIRMLYKGTHANVDKAGNIHLSTVFGDIIDHAPLTFYADNHQKLASFFELRDNIVSFKVQPNYDKTKTVIIDPWTTNPLFTSQNKALEVERDATGNAYVYGGYIPFKLRKYNTLGVAQWTSNTIPSSTNWFGDLATDNAGNCYVSNGQGNGEIQKINTSGATLVTNTTGFTGQWEYFALTFDKAQTKLIGGTSVPSSGNPGAVVNVNLTTLNPSNMTGGLGVMPWAEIRGLCASDNGNYYGISIDNGNPGKVIAFTYNFAPLWNINSGYTSANFGYSLPSYQYGAPGGQNCIAASRCYVYTYNGDTLRKRSITNGALIGQIKITNGGKGLCSGVIVDSCDNVYVGTTTGVRKYDNSLAFVSSATTAGAVYDIAFGANQEILVAGNALAASVAGLVVPCPQSALSLTVSSTPALCGQNTGSATVVVGGGTTPYNYKWSPSGQTNSSATGLGAGVYTVSVTDNSCAILTKTASVTVTAAGGMTVSVSSSTNVSCNGGSNGAASINIAGGTGPFSYLWSSGQTIQNVTNFPAGTFSVTVTDGPGCTGQTAVIITQPLPLTVTLTPTHITCNGYANGSIMASAGGSTGFDYVWSTGATSSSISNLPVNTYSVIVTDNNNCSVQSNAAITQPLAITSTITSTADFCGQSNGTAAVTAANGTSPYFYLWTTNATANSVNGLSAGSYSVTITDNNGCTSVTTTTITSSAGDTLQLVNTVSTACNGACVGSINVQPIGTNGPYNYAWSTNPVQATTTATGLCAGTYSCTLTDINGCTDVLIASVNGSSAMTISLTATNPACNGAGTGSVMITQSGGSPPFTYNWSTGETTLSVTNLFAGSYSVSVTDNSGCSATSVAQIIDPPVLMAAMSPSATAICAGQLVSLSANANGGTGGYIYLWNTAQTTAAITTTPANTTTYSIIVNDANGCSAQAIIEVTVNPLPIVSFTTDATSGCDSLCVSFSNLTVGAQNQIWDFGNGAGSSQANPAYCYTQSGSYSISLQVTDNSGCSNTLLSNNYLTLYPNPVADFQVTPNPVDLNLPANFIDQSVGATGWSWSFGDGVNSSSTVQNPSFTYPDTGNYQVQLIVRNNEGCTDTLIQQLIVNAEMSLYMANSFTPNNDGINDVFVPQGIITDYKEYTLYIFDRWGGEIFKSKKLEVGWDGKANGGDLVAQQDTYVWMVILADSSGRRRQYLGHVNLVK